VILQSKIQQVFGGRRTGLQARKEEVDLDFATGYPEIKITILVKFGIC